MIPTPGRIVEYTLSQVDVDLLNQRQRDIDSMPASVAATALLPNHNPLRAGDTYPLVITRVWGVGEGSAVNGQVLLDGDHSLWVTSRIEGEGEFHWRPYPRV